MNERYDALVIGGDVCGLTAGAYLGRAGLRTLVLEAGETLAPLARAQALSALDPVVIKELKLLRHGLTFAERDLALAAPTGEGVVLGRDVHLAARSLAPHSKADAAAYPAFRRALYRLAKALRLAWWNGAPFAEAVQGLKRDDRALAERLSVTSAASWLDGHFESDAVKALLVCDAARHAMSPGDAGSAMALVWAASQEMCGLQGAVAVANGGAGGVADALTKAAQGANVLIQTAAPVAALLHEGPSVTGVRLASGEQISAPLVLSSLSRRATLLDLAPAGLAGLGCATQIARSAAQIGSALLTLSGKELPQIVGHTAMTSRRYIFAERMENYAAACTQARLGHMPDEPIVELIAQPLGRATGEPQDRCLLSIRIWPVLVGATRDDLLARTRAVLRRHIPQILQGWDVWDLQMPQPADPATIDNLLGGYDGRIRTPLHGLFLCGVAAEPLPEISGRAARHAARAAIAAHRKLAAP